MAADKCDFHIGYDKYAHDLLHKYVIQRLYHRGLYRHSTKYIYIGILIINYTY